MIITIIGLCYAASVTQIAGPNRNIVDPGGFYGLSSLFLKGVFDDLNPGTYQVNLGSEAQCQILSVKPDEIECLTPGWDSLAGLSPGLEVLHNSIEIYSSLSFEWLWYPDPLISLMPNEAAAGDAVNFYFLAFESNKANLKLQIEGISATFEPDVLEQYSAPFVINAQIGQNVHGDQNMVYELYGSLESVYVVEGLMWPGAGYTLQGNEYWFRTIAAVDTISVGNSLTITGNSFPSDPSRVKVDIYGIDFPVTQASFGTIECTNQGYLGSGTAGYYEGGAGLVKETYTPGNIRVNSELVSKTTIPSATIAATMENYDSLIYGLFKAPYSGNYIFYTSFRGSVKVFLSSDSSPSNKQEIINSSQESDEYLYFISADNQSGPIALVAGESYYLEVEHSSSGGRNSFSLGVEMPGTGKKNGFPMVKRVNVNSNTLDSNYPFNYKGQSKEIVTSIDCTNNNYFQQSYIGETYFNLYVYCHGNYLYALLPSYMNPVSSDLKFNSGGTLLEGETLREASSNSRFWFVIPSDFLRTYEAKPQLRVRIDNRLALCRGDCSFQVIIKSFSESSKVVTITGENLPTDASKLQVKVGPMDCSIKANSNVLIECELDYYVTGDYRPEVTYNQQLIALDPSINNFLSFFCSPDCLKCHSSSVFDCLECKRGYLVQGVCNPVCPTGYSCSSTGSSLTGNFVFHLELNTMKNVVNDSQSSIPVLSGVNSQFHPFFEQTDPYPSKDRGYYFKGTSVMQLPPYDNITSPLLVVSPEFTVSIWTRPTSGSGTLLSKRQGDSGTLEIELSDFSLSVLNNTFHEPKLSNYWELVTVRSFIEDSEFKLEGYSNATQLFSKSLGTNWLKDADSEFYFTIGAKANNSESFTSFFEGFVWEVRLYNSKIDLAELASSNCKNCETCPLGNSNECLPTCEIDEFWDGQKCQACNPGCNFGCVNNSTCTLCGNDLCTECLFEKCTSCVENSHIEDSTCECNWGYTENQGTCEIDSFYANLTANEDKKLMLKFSESPKLELQPTDYRIYLKNETIKFSYSEKLLSRDNYQFNLVFKSYVSRGEIAYLEFTNASRIVSKQNSTLQSKTLQAELYEYNPWAQETKQAESEGQTATLFGIGISGLSAIFSPNPSGLWATINTIQILTFIALTSNPLTPRVRGFLKGLNPMKSIIPNAFKYFLDFDSRPNPHYYSKDYGYDSYLFLDNIGADLTVLGFLLVLLPIIWFLSKIPRYKRFYEKILGNYRYKAIVRFWIIIYLDLVIPFFIQIYSTDSDATEVTINLALAVTIGLLLVVTPGAIVLLCVKNKASIQVSEDLGVYKRYKTLFYEFDCSHNFKASYTYAFFTLVRLLLGASFIFLAEFAYVQAAVNCILMFLSLSFFLGVRPYKSRFEQTISIVVEIGVLAAYSGAAYFININQEEDHQTAEIAMVYLVYSIMVLRTLFIATKAVIKISGWIKRKCQRTHVVPELMTLETNNGRSPTIQDNSLFVRKPKSPESFKLNNSS